MVHRIKPKKPNFKKIKRELRKLVMNQPQLQSIQGGQALAANGQIPGQVQEVVLNATDSYVQTLQFLNNMQKQVVLPSNIKSERLEKLFADIQTFIADRLKSEISAGVVEV